MDVVSNIPKGRVRVWMFYQAYRKVGYGTAACTRNRTRPLIFQRGRTRYQSIFQWEYRTYQSVGYRYGCRTKLTKVSVQVWMSYQAYQSVGYGYGCRTKLVKGSGMVQLLVPVPVPDPRYFNRAISSTRIFSSGSTEFTKV